MMVKVCGMREPENIRAVEQEGVDWIGFIFYPGSPRFVNRVPDYLPANAKRVGVFVNEDPEVIRGRIEEYGLDLVQLHGDETPEDCRVLRSETVQVMKAFPIESGRPFPWEKVESYHGACDYYLFDTRSGLRGGSGRKFDWQVLDAYQGKTPFLLSGGIGPGDLSALAAFSHPRWVGIDVNSRFELGPGHKDVGLLAKFIKGVREIFK